MYAGLAWLDPTLWWRTAALIAGVAACVLVTQAVRRLRRARERSCPACGYSMCGLPGLTCPECGHTAPSEPNLWPRQRWRARMLTGAVLLVAAPGLATAPDWRLLLRLLPFDYLLVIASEQPRPSAFADECSRELNRMLSDTGLTEDQYLRLVEFLWNSEGLESFIQSASVGCDGRIRLRWAYTHFSVHRPPDSADGVAAWITLSHKTCRFVPMLRGRMHRPGNNDWFLDFARIAVLAPSAPEASEAVVAELACPQLQHGSCAMNAIIANPSVARAKAVAVHLKAADPEVRGYAAEILREFGPEVAPALPELIEAVNCREGSVSLDAKEAILALNPPPESLLPHLAGILGSWYDKGYRGRGDGRHADARSTTTDLMILIGPAAIPELIKNLEHDNMVVRVGAAECLGDFGSEAQTALPALERFTVDSRDHNPDRVAARKAIAKIKQAASGGG